MDRFEDREAVEERLDRLDYEDFWRGIADLDIDLPSRTLMRRPDVSGNQLIE